MKIRRASFFVQLAFLLMIPFFASAQTFLSISGSEGYYCIKYPDGSTGLGKHVGGGQVGAIDFEEGIEDFNKKLKAIKKKLAALREFIENQNDSRNVVQKILRTELPTVAKAKSAIKKFKEQQAELLSVLETISHCQDATLDFTGAGNLTSIFVFPGPNNFPDRNFTGIYIPLDVTRNKKGQVKTNLNFCISYLAWEGADHVKLSPYEYSVTFINDPCSAGKHGLSGFPCPGLFGGPDKFGHIVTALDGIGPDPNTGWINQKLSDIRVVTRPKGKLGCLGDSGFVK